LEDKESPFMTYLRQNDIEQALLCLTPLIRKQLSGLKKEDREDLSQELYLLCFRIIRKFYLETGKDLLSYYHDKEEGHANDESQKKGKGLQENQCKGIQENRQCKRKGSS
jgi:hypothetical protein